MNEFEAVVLARKIANEQTKPLAKIMKGRKMAETVSDEHGNVCSVEFFGSFEAANAALLSLVNCRNCTNCKDCQNCTDCVECSSCYECHQCERCHQCGELLFGSGMKGEFKTKPQKFEIGEMVLVKERGRGWVLGVFNLNEKLNKPVCWRYVVRHNAEGGWFFVEIYSSLELSKV